VVAVLPALYAAYVETGQMALPSSETGADLGATSLTTLLVAASSALATVLAVWLGRRFLGGPRLLDLGLRLQPGWQIDVLIGLLAGPLMFGVILLVMVAAGWAQVGPGTIDGRGLLTAFVTYVLVAFSEEVLSRGWVLQTLERGYGTTVAMLGSAVLFAVLHAFNPGFGLPALLGLFLAGVLFAQAYLVTRQLWLPMAFHLSWNFSEGPIYGFPVSGLPGEGLLTVRPTGPDVVTGGAFGPEAGLIVIVGMVPAALLLLLLGRWRRRAGAPG
jgi:membrane protease YdiL (CAAX protease family)